jgi:hypothetical protein
VAISEAVIRRIVNWDSTSRPVFLGLRCVAATVRVGLLGDAGNA